MEWLALGETDMAKQHHEDGSLAWKVVQVSAWPACACQCALATLLRDWLHLRQPLQHLVCPPRGSAAPFSCCLPPAPHFPPQAACGMNHTAAIIELGPDVSIPS